MKNRNYILVSLLFLVVFLFSFYFKKDEVIILNDLPKEEVKNIIATPKIISDIKEDKEFNQINKIESFVSLIIFENKYKVSFSEGDTVYSIMMKLQKENSVNFEFKYKEYPSLGVFVYEINGIENGDGKYWFYYVNDKEATVGVSKYLLKEGDVISWKLN